MTTKDEPSRPDSLHLPDSLSPQRYDSHHGRPESYWEERNALVDAARAVPVRIDGVFVYEAAGWDLPGAAEARAAYAKALDDLKAFDARNGGTPIL